LLYFDVLINRITQSGYRCYIGLVFLAVFVYAEYVVSLAPTATARRHILSICDNFAIDFIVIFNVQKFKCIFFDSAVSHPSCLLLTFNDGINVIEFDDIVDVDYSVLNLLIECTLLRDNQSSCSGLDFYQHNCIITLFVNWTFWLFTFSFFITIMLNIANNCCFLTK